MKKIGLKYCGGCNPMYDRVAFVNRLKKQAQGGIEFVSHEDKVAELVLVVAGCEKTCVDLGRLNGCPIHIVDKENGAGELINCIIK